MRLLRLLCMTMTLTAFSAMSDNVKIQFYTPEIVRVLKQPEGSADVARESRVVIAKPENVKVKTMTKDGVTTYTSGSLVVKVDDDADRVSFFTPDGRKLMTEGRHGFTPITDGIDKGAYKVMQSFALDADDRFMVSVCCRTARCHCAASTG